MGPLAIEIGLGCSPENVGQAFSSIKYEFDFARISFKRLIDDSSRERA
jgi:hypothetical protein